MHDCIAVDTDFRCLGCGKCVLCGEEHGTDEDCE